MSKKTENSEISKDNSTFNRLQEIQVLIKKESGLKDLCMQYNNIILYFKQY